MNTIGVALLAAGAMHASAHHHHQRVQTVACPAGVPVQSIAVANQANVPPKALAQVERAVTDQSIQLRAAWGTPCVTWAPGGWTFTLTASAPKANPDGSTTASISGHHDPGALYVDTGQNPASTWARAFSHEVLEALADPNDDIRWKWGLREVCDPVENLTYAEDGVQVSDFVFPSYFENGAGPYDQTGALTANAG